MLAETERRTREQYNHLIKEQKAQNVLLTNLQTIQNNLERSEFETKSRLTSQVQVLEKEAGLLKEKVHNEEERREKMKDAYETQVKGKWSVTFWNLQSLIMIDDVLEFAWFVELVGVFLTFEVILNCEMS